MMAEQGDDALESARAALEAGDPSEALRRAFKVTKNAVRTQDDDMLRSAAALAATIAESTDGRVAKEARQYSLYWLACIEEPRDQQSNAWSFRSWFQRTPREKRRPCPQCAESIVVDAKVCRFCGHRLDAS